MAQGSALETRGPGRFLFLDALRGFAALIVVLYHVWRQNLSPILGLKLPEPFESFVSAGNMGVPIFFVLSGFVIAHSVFAKRITPSYFGRFVLRRSLRLDPPYWASIALAIATAALSAYVLKRQGVEFPSAFDVTVHLFYLQELLGVPNIIGVYWTLCYEIQFYLAFVAVLGISQYLGRGSLYRINAFGFTAFTALWCTSLLMERGFVACPRGVFLSLWFHFFTGVAAYWAYRGFIPAWMFAVVLVGSLVAEPLGSLRSTTVTGTAALLFVSSRTGHLWTASCGRLAQFLGKTSYSLYLTHMLVGSRIARFAAERQPDMSLAMAAAWLVIATVASILFAWIFYLLIERPSIGWSRAIPLTPTVRRSLPARMPPAAASQEV